MSIQASHRISCLLLDTLIIDTGSSVTWLGAGKPYVKTKSSMQTLNDVVRFSRYTLITFTEFFPLGFTLRLWA
jgi:hypothetical protein